MNTRKRILDNSRILFNELGYSNVTIRKIALSLNMSSGNLNYHFKKRDDILEALYFEMVQDFDERILNLKSREISLKTIKEDIFSSLNRMLKYQFIWTDLFNLLRMNERINSHFVRAHLNRLEGYKYLFQALEKKGVMCKIEDSLELSYLIDRMISISNTWIYSSFIYGVKITQDTIYEESYKLLYSLAPYLTDAGRLEFNRIVSK